MARHDLVPAAPAGFGFALSIVPPVPLVDTAGAFAVSPEKLLDWAAEANEGARCVYARCDTISRYVQLRECSQLLARQGVVALNFVRHAAGDGLFDYIAKRTCAPVGGKAPARAPIRVSSLAASEKDDEIAMLMAVLRRQANRGQAMGTNRELGEEIGGVGPDRVAYLLREQIGAGRIVVEAVGIGGRICTIVATGKRTAVPA